jgi:hypothetical protein
MEPRHLGGGSLNVHQVPVQPECVFVDGLDAATLIVSLSVAVPVFYVNGEMLAQQDAILRCAVSSFLKRICVSCKLV